MRVQISLPRQVTKVTATQRVHEVSDRVSSCKVRGVVKGQSDQFLQLFVVEEERNR